MFKKMVEQACNDNMETSFNRLKNIEAVAKEIRLDCERVMHEHHACVYRSLIQSINDRLRNILEVKCANKINDQ